MGSHAVATTRASQVARRPPEGKEDASGSRTSSLPENSMMAVPSPPGADEAIVLLAGDAGQGLEPVECNGWHQLMFSYT